MKILITGHTRGLGKFLYEKCLNAGHDVTGFSFSTGYDINTESARNKIIAHADSADMFINNAFGFDNVNAEEKVIKNYRKGTNGQNILLEMFIESWKDTNKKILHVNSKFKTRNPQKLPIGKIYSLEKSHADKIIKNMTSNKPNVLNFTPGMFESDTASVWPEFFQRSKVEDIGEFLFYFVNSCNLIWPNEIVLDKTDLIERPLVELLKSIEEYNENSNN